MRHTNKIQNKKSPKDPVAPKAAPRERNGLKMLANAPFFLLSWLLFTLFGACVYGDVFYMCEQYGFFAFDRTLMQHLLDTPFGWYVCLGRMLLLSFKWPLLGAVLWGGILALITRLTAYTFRLPARFRALSLLPAAGIVMTLLHKDLNLYYHDEPAFAFLLPLTVLFLLLLTAAGRRLYTRFTRPAAPATQPDLAVRIAQPLLLIATVACLSAGAFMFKENVLLTARMQRLMQQQDWDSIIETALKAKAPSRPVAAYYAMALVHTDGLNDRLFDIHYQYPRLNIRKNGQPDLGGELYQHDANFHAGLIQTSYHNALEYQLMNGTSIDKLKRLFLCSLLSNEQSLAEKYLHILRQVPFENAFCTNYAPILADRSLLASDPELSRVLELSPTEDAFEADFQAPLFLGYNVVRRTGRSSRALEASLAACLYAKLVPAAVERAGSLGGRAPKSVEEAAAYYATQHPDMLKGSRFSPIILNRMQNFFNESRNLKADKREKARLLKDNYHDFYPYYYFYENLPEADTPQQTQENKGSVN